VLKWYEGRKDDGPVEERERRLATQKEKGQRKSVSRRRRLQNCREV